MPTTRPLTLTAGDGPLVASTISNSAELLDEIFSVLFSRSTQRYHIDLSVYPGRSVGVPRRYSPAATCVRNVPSTCTLSVAALFVFTGSAGVGAPLMSVTGRVILEGDMAPPSTE